MRLGSLRCRVPDVHALADLRRRVGHDADERAMLETVAQRCGGGARDDGDHELLGRQAAAKFLKHTRHHLGFDAEHHDVTAARRLGIVGRDVDPVFLAQRVPALGAWVTGDDVAGGNQLALEDPGNDRLGHHPGSDDAERRCPQWTHLRILRSAGVSYIGPNASYTAICLPALSNGQPSASWVAASRDAASTMLYPVACEPIGPFFTPA